MKEVVQPNEYIDLNKDSSLINLEYNTFMEKFLRSCIIDED